MSEPIRPDYDYRPRRQATSGPSWPVVALAAVLIGALGLGVGLVVAGMLDEPPPASDDGAPSPSASASTAESAVGQPVASSPPSTPRGTLSELAPGAVAAAAAAGIALREEPSADATLVGRLAEGSHSYVVDGPTSAEGYEWFQVTGMGIPPNSGCAGPIQTDPFNCPVWFGWAAAGSLEGEPWLEPVTLECPEPGPLDEAWVDAHFEPMSLLACFASDTITVVGWVPEIPEDGGLGGACPQYEPNSAWLCDLGYQRLTLAEGDDFFAQGVSVAVPPDGADEFEALRGQWLQVTGHFDDPAAQGCPEGHERQRCRARLVVESAAPTEAP